MCVVVLNKSSCSWQCLLKEEREEEDGRRRTLSFLFFRLEKISACISLYGCWQTIQPHTHTHQGGKEAAKKARREVSLKEEDGGRRKEEGRGGHLVLSVHTHIHSLEEWENCFRSELQPGVGLDLFLKIWCLFYKLLTFTTIILIEHQGTAATSKTEHLLVFYLLFLSQFSFSSFEVLPYLHQLIYSETRFLHVFKFFTIRSFSSK